jgi:hypothetical protein
MGMQRNRLPMDGYTLWAWGFVALSVVLSLAGA